MTRQRLRPAWSESELAGLYAQPHQHRRFSDHVLRVAATIGVGTWMSHGEPFTVAADLSCGDGAVLDAIPAHRKVYGDYAPGWQVTGPIETTIDQIELVDLLVCAETIEHLDDPDLVLRKARPRAAALLLSTPVDAWDDTNPEHYWAWSKADVEAMLTEAGFTPMVYTAVDFRPAGLPYCFGIWAAQ